MVEHVRQDGRLDFDGGVPLATVRANGMCRLTPAASVGRELIDGVCHGVPPSSTPTVLTQVVARCLRLDTTSITFSVNQLRRPNPVLASIVPSSTGLAPPYNRVVTESDPASRSAILSRDTSLDVERLQIESWRQMSPLQKAGIINQATRDALTLAVSGIRQRHPGASERECFIRLAALQLGPTLVRQVYPDASQILGPHV